jgi:hypothetical protein
MTSSKARLVPLTGVAALVLLVVGAIVGGEPPELEDTGDEVLAFYQDDEGAQIASSILVTYGALFLVFFASTIRSRLRREEEPGGVLSAAAFGGGLLIALGIALFAGINFTLADAADDLDPAAAQALNALNLDLFFPVALGTAVFFWATGLGMVRAAGLPSWLGWTALVLAVVSLTPIGFFAFLAGGLWILAASVLFALRPAGGSPGAPPPAAPPTAPPEIR